ncbi:MAG: nitrophenyl compound nitroreductase subunit ArsF family protein [Bacteroidetes bacterium]|nr:nitrophenyl compound nitroreductase subunit ArsF family protein [Bacteroidota bacterium]
MKKAILLFILMVMVSGTSHVFSQSKPTALKKAKVEVYYFHPGERCPIDQTIEESARKMMQTDFATQIREGILRFQVINTDDKSQAKTVARFEINAQALYIVTFDKAREVKKDLTEFAFSNAQSNPGRFKTGLKQEILDALK